MSEEKITQWFINNINGTPSEEQLALRKVYEQQQEIERLQNIINEQDKELELERKSRQLLTDDLANVCEISLKKENIIKEAREYLYEALECKYHGSNMTYDKLIHNTIDILGKENGDSDE